MVIMCCSKQYRFFCGNDPYDLNLSKIVVHISDILVGSNICRITQEKTLTVLLTVLSWQHQHNYLVKMDLKLLVTCCYKVLLLPSTRGFHSLAYCVDAQKGSISSNDLLIDNSLQKCTYHNGEVYDIIEPFTLFHFPYSILIRLNLHMTQ